MATTELPDMPLSFHPLTFVADGEDVVIGRPDTDSYAVFPDSGAALLHRLRDGLSPAAGARWYEDTYGEEVDMADFLDTLRELDFVAGDGDAVDVVVDAAGERPGSVSWRWLGRAAFSVPAWIGYLALVTACGVALARVPALRPSPHQVFFTRSLLVIQLVLLVGQTGGIAWHEGFHMLAGRRLGLPCRLSIGRRLYFFVFETTLFGLLGVPKRRRYLPLLAGMLADVLMFSALTLGAAASRRADGGFPLLGRLALAMAFLTVLRFTWQFYLFLRTDLYFVLTHALRCHDLHGATNAFLRNLAHRRLPQRVAPVDESAWADRDRRMARWYAPFMVAGVLVLTATVAAAVVPIAVEFGRRLVTGLWTGSWDARFWDSGLSAVFALGPLLLLFVLGLRDQLRRRLPSLTTSRTRLSD